MHDLAVDQLRARRKALIFIDSTGDKADVTVMNIIHFYYSSFQMTVESNYVIVIATLNDWLKRLDAPVFQPMRSKSKTNHSMCT